MKEKNYLSDENLHGKFLRKICLQARFSLFQTSLFPADATCATLLEDFTVNPSHTNFFPFLEQPKKENPVNLKRISTFLFSRENCVCIKGPCCVQIKLTEEKFFRLR
jgi:hypothetical protein